MTTTTPDSVGVTVPETRRPSGRVRFAVAFLVGLLAGDRRRVPGPCTRTTSNTSAACCPASGSARSTCPGLEPAVAAERLRDAYGSLGEGEIIVKSPQGTTSISFADIGRGPDVEAMLAEALAVGREGNPVERVIADARTAIRGVTLQPRVTYDPDALAERIVAYADSLAREPVDGSVEAVKTRFVVHAGVAGRLADAAVAGRSRVRRRRGARRPCLADLRPPRPRGRAGGHHGRGHRRPRPTAERIAAEVTLSAKTGKQKITAVAAPVVDHVRADRRRRIRPDHGHRPASRTSSRSSPRRSTRLRSTPRSRHPAAGSPA